MTVVFDVAVDWENDGDFTGTGEDVSARVLANPGITLERGRDQIRGLAPPMAGQASFDLNNISKDYSPEYSSSPLYGNLLPGRPVRIRGDDGTVRNVWRGFLDEMTQHPERDKRSTSFRCLGGLSKLRAQDESQKVGTALYENIRTDQAVGYILDAVGWAAGDRVLDTGKTTLLYWWLDNEDAFDAAVAVLATEGPGAALYEDSQGRIVFESRHYRLLTARCTSSQATFSDTGSEPLHSAPFGYDGGQKGVVNACSIKVNTRQVESLQKIWSLGQTVTLAPNEVRKYPAKGNDVFKAAQCTAGTDYTVAAGSLSSVALDRTSGASCTITLTAGASGATVTGLQLRATPVTVANTTEVANTISTTASQNAYGRRSYSLPTRPEISINVAQDFTNAVVGIYQNPRPTVEMTVKNRGTINETELLTRNISDRITVVEAQTAANHEYFVERIRLTVQEGGKYINGVLGCEKAVGSNYGIYGTGAYGTAVWGF